MTLSPPLRGSGLLLRTVTLGAVVLSLFSCVAAVDPSQACAFLNGVLLSVKLPAGGQIAVGRLTTCICVPDIPTMILTHPVLSAARGLVGDGQVTTVLTDLIIANAPTCSYPDGAIPKCSANGIDACDYQCLNGFLPPSDPSQRACECLEPYMTCNGVCGSFIGCASGIPQLPPTTPTRRNVRGSYSDLFPRSSRSRYGIETLCPPGQTPCGSPNNGRHAWECVDTQHDLASCGGCVLPGPFSKQVTVGRDCSAIMRADGVACSRGRCVVESCMDGFIPSPNGSECVPKSSEDVLHAGLGTQMGL